MLPVMCSRCYAAWDVLPGVVLPGNVPPGIAALELHPGELLSGRRHFAIMAVILAGVLFAVSDFVWIF